jgi:hypothetical protein
LEFSTDKEALFVRIFNIYPLSRRFSDADFERSGQNGVKRANRLDENTARHRAIADRG